MIIVLRRYIFVTSSISVFDVDKEIVTTVMKIFQDKDLGTQDSLSGTGLSHFPRNFIKFAIRPRKKCCVSGSPTVVHFWRQLGTFFY